MAKVSPEKWKKAEALRKAGKSYRAISKELNIPSTTLADRAKRDDWIDGIQEITKRGIVILPNILYLITSEEFQADGIYKIGITNDIEFRLKCMQTGCPFKLFAYKAYLHDNPLGIEQSLHAFFGKKRLEGEWFKLSHVDLNYIEEALGNG